MYENLVVNRNELIVVVTQAVAISKLSINAMAAVAAREMTTVQPELFIHIQDDSGSQR
jgi:hypothetical protein